MVKSDQHADTAEIQRRIAVENAEAWRPNAGELITGTVVKIGVYEHELYGKSPVVTLETVNGLRKVYAIHQTLTTRLFELKPAVGTELTIAYLGIVKSNSRTDAKTGEPIEYHKYSVIGGAEEAEETPW